MSSSTTLLRAVLVTGLMAAAMPALAQEAPAQVPAAPVATAPETAPAQVDAPPAAETPAEAAAAPRAAEAPLETAPEAATTAADQPVDADAVEAPATNTATNTATDVAAQNAPESAPVEAAPVATAPAATAPAVTELVEAAPANLAPADATPVAAAAEDVAPTDPAAQPAPASEPAEAGVAHGLQGHDLSPMGMYRQADIVVKAVMIALVVSAILAWIILVAKLLQLAAVRAKARRVLGIVSRATDLDAAKAEVRALRGLPATMVRAADDEVAASQDIIAQGLSDGVKERVASRLSRIEAAAGRKIGQGVGILASIGSVGPFVGLFGTVWGIMNAFIGIAESQTTNLAVVAPGIAEALLATAFGLVAAIPAVLIYNGLARATTGYRALLADLSAAIERVVSRDLDRAAIRAQQGN